MKRHNLYARRHSIARAFVAPIACLLLILPHSPSRAALTSIEIVPVVQNVIPGTSVYDVLVNGTGQFLGIDMRIELTSGSVYQDALGSHTPPNATFFSAAPTLAFDTFVGMGGRTSDTTLPFQFFDNSPPMSPVVLDILWAPDNPGVFDPEDFFVARLTLSDDAAGAIRLRHLPPGGTPDFEQTFAIPIVIAQPIPEPTTSPSPPSPSSPAPRSSAAPLSNSNA